MNILKHPGRIPHYNLRSDRYPHQWELAAALLSMPERNREIHIPIFFRGLHTAEIGRKCTDAAGVRTGYQINRTLQFLHNDMEECFLAGGRSMKEIIEI